VTADWTNYFSVMAGAAATLTGLVFVSVSINLPRILDGAGLPGRAAESLVQLFGVVIISAAVLIPAQSQTALGIEVLAIGSLLWVTQTISQCRYLASKTGHPLAWALQRMIQTQFATVPFCVAGVLLMRGSPAAMYWLVPGCIFSLVGGVIGAWILLVEILR
jgi:modulator of FtsH protease